MSTFNKGDLLIASATLMDPNFQHTVVLLCDFNEEGCSGIVLNRPVQPTREALEQLPFVEDRLYFGGPVQPRAIQILHPYGSLVDGAMEILPDVWIGGDFEEIQSNFRTGVFDFSRCRFFVGYAGWATKQLEEEWESGSWLSIPGTEGFVNETSPQNMWSTAIHQYGIRKDPMFANYPSDPRLN